MLHMEITTGLLSQLRLNRLLLCVQENVKRKVKISGVTMSTLMAHLVSIFALLPSAKPVIFFTMTITRSKKE